MKKYKFKAIIRPGSGGGAAVIFHYSVEREFGIQGRVPVRATFNGVPYTGSLVKCGADEHMLGVQKAIRAQIGKGPGDDVDVVLWRDDRVRTVELPAVLQETLSQKGLLDAFEKLSYTHRKEYCRWIIEAKKEETRQSRLAKAVDMLSRGIKTPG
jgi:hypothetical protein